MDSTPSSFLEGNPADLDPLSVSFQSCSKGGVPSQILASQIGEKGECIEALRNSSEILMQAGRHSEALPYLQTWAELEPRSCIVHAMIGSVFASLQQWEDARSALCIALGLSPQDADLLAAAAKVAWNLNRIPEAFGYIHQAIALQVSDASLRNDLGVMHAHIGEQHQAVMAFSEALKIAPEIAEYQYNMAQTLRSLGRSEEALLHAQCAVDAGSPSTAMVATLGLILSDLDRYIEAVSILAQIDVFASSETTEAYVEALRKLRRHEEAASVLAHGLMSAPSNADLWLFSGRLHVDQGDFAEAKKCFDAALELAPWNGAIHRAKANLHRYSPGDPHLAEMEVLAKSVMPWTQDYLEIHFALAKAFDDIGEFKRAIKHLNLANGAKRKVTPYDEHAYVTWFESVIRLFQDPIVSHAPALENASNVPVFVVGMPRSGTTLIEQILASHTDVVGMGELLDFQKICADVTAHVHGEGNKPLSSEDFAQIGSRYLKTIALQSAGKLRAVDKLPSNVFFLGYIVRALPNARIIHVRRDPIDTCISIYSKLFGGIQSFSYDQSELGRYYRYYQQVSDHWTKVIPSDNLLEVDYEAVVEDTEREARRMISFLQLPWDEACLQPHKRSSLVMTASAFQVRNPIYKTSVGRRHGYLAYLEPLVEALNGC